MAAFDTEIFDILCQVLESEFGADPKRLTPDLELGELHLDQEEYHHLYALMAEKTDVNLHKIVNSMPLYSVDEGDWTMRSLQNLAAFSNEAAEYLDRCDVRTEKETLRSITQSFAAGEYVSSGLYFDPFFPPRSKTYVIALSLGIVLALVVIGPVIWASWPCKPLLWVCYGGPGERYLHVLPYVGGVAAILLAFAYCPGWLALRSKRRRRERRGTM